MKKFYVLMMCVAHYYLGASQCTPATILSSSTINTPGYTLNSSFNSSSTASATISNLSSGMFTFTASVGGTATWSTGVQIQNDATVGNYIFVQPTNTDNASSANAATYTVQIHRSSNKFLPSLCRTQQPRSTYHYRI